MEHLNFLPGTREAAENPLPDLRCSSLLVLAASGVSRAAQQEDLGRSAFGSRHSHGESMTTAPQLQRSSRLRVILRVFGVRSFLSSRSETGPDPEGEGLRLKRDRKPAGVGAIQLRQAWPWSSSRMRRQQKKFHLRISLPPERSENAEIRSKKPGRSLR